MHAVAMEVTAVKVNGIAAASWAISDEDDTLTVHLNQTLEANTNVRVNPLLIKRISFLYSSGPVDDKGR